MSDNNWEVYELYNRHRHRRRPQSQTRPHNNRTPQASSNLQPQMQNYELVMRDNRPCVLPDFRRGTGSRRPLNRLQQQAAAASDRLYRATASAIRRFLMLSHHNPATMSSADWLEGSGLVAVPPPPPAQNGAAAASQQQPPSNTVVGDDGVERVREESIPGQEFETDESGGGTQPYINLLDNPIQNDEVAAEEPDLTLKL